MTNPVFPTLSMQQDSRFYSVSQEDVAMKTKMEGGYVVSRAKHTRRPRKMFTTGYTDIGNADRVLLQNFWDTVKGNSVIFDWTDPITQQVISVRFGNDKLMFKYSGIGISQRWEVQIELEEA